MPDAAERYDDRVDAPAGDGRVRRGERSKAAVVDAILSLLAEGQLRPGVALIAERAGVGERSVFRHFQDLEGLHAAAADRHLEAIIPLVRPIPPGSRDERIDAFVGQRVRILDADAPLRRAARLNEPFSSAIRARLARGRRVLRSQVEQAFAPELDVLAPGPRSELLAALDAVTTWELWDVLRSQQNLSSARARPILERTVRSLLSGTPSDRN